MTTTQVCPWGHQHGPHVYHPFDGDRIAVECAGKAFQPPKSASQDRCTCGHGWNAHSAGSSGCNGTIDCPGGWTGCPCVLRVELVENAP